MSMNSANTFQTKTEKLNSWKTENVWLDLDCKHSYHFYHYLLKVSYFMYLYFATQPSVSTKLYKS